MNEVLLPEVPQRANIAWGEGLWYDFVFELARWEIPGSPLSCYIGRGGWEGIFYGFEHHYHRPDLKDSNLWTALAYPPVFDLHIENFAAASVAAIDLLLDWGSTGQCPFQYRIDMQGETGSRSRPMMNTSIEQRSHLVAMVPVAGKAKRQTSQLMGSVDAR